MIFSLLTLILLAPGARASETIITPCQKEESAGLPCRSPREALERALAAARSKGKRAVLLFGSRKCGPCLAWKRHYSEHPPGESIDIIYMPLSFFPSVQGRSREDEGVVAACERAVKDFQVSSERLPREIRNYPACHRKPTILLVDPRSEKGSEIHPGAVKEPEGVAALLEEMGKGLSKPDPSPGAEPERLASPVN